MKSEESFFNFSLKDFHFSLLVLSVYAVATAAIAELLKLKPSRRVLFVLGRCVVALFALSALQNNVISWHFFPSVVSSRWSVASSVFSDR